MSSAKKPGLMVAIALGKGKHGEPDDEAPEELDDEPEGEDEDGAAIKDAAHELVLSLGLDPEKLDMDKVVDALCAFSDLHSEMKG